MRVPLFLEARHGSQKIKAVRKVASIKSSPIRRTSLHESDAVVPDNDCRSCHHDGFGHRGWVNKTRVIPHPMRRIGWGCIAGRALARLQLYSIEYGSGAHFSMIRHHQIPMDVTVADAVCAVSK